MGTPGKPQPVKLFCALMFKTGANISVALNALEQAFGPVDYSLGPLPFDHTPYYHEETGSPLSKTYLTFAQSIPRERLPSIKNLTNELEASWAVDGRRTINLDPGYLSNDKFVLASTKDFFHRIYLGDGIFGELTLHFRGGRFCHFSWTYPDYKDKAVQDFLIKARARLVGANRKLLQVH